MSYSLYIACDNEVQKNELLNILKENFNYDEVYIGDDLTYAKDIYKNRHVGFHLNNTDFLSKLCFICLVILAKKRNLKVFWDETDLKISDIKDSEIKTIQKFLLRFEKHQPFIVSVILKLRIFSERKEIKKYNETIKIFETL